jgi:NADPH:quinone reductase-like Zn-dependent oxidoreductase
MLAMAYQTYGGPEVVHPTEMPRPVPGAAQVLVKLAAAGVTTADWRMRASDFPGGMWLVGRLAIGLFRPRNHILGGDFAGDVVAVGAQVTKFQPGDRVFGTSGTGAHAEYLAIGTDGAIALTPVSVPNQAGAALAFGAICALDFLRDFAKVKPGQKVLIIGASGGVGCYAVQIAKWLGAEVTGVASGASQDLVMSLGVDHFVDYQAQDVTRLRDRFDLIFDTVGVLKFRAARALLARNGLFLPLNFGPLDLWHVLWSRITGGPRISLHVNGDSQQDTETLANLVRDGHLRPVIDRVFRLENIRAAYAHVESRHRLGAVVLDIGAEHPIP